MQYSLINWGSANKSTINPLEKLQKLLELVCFAIKELQLETFCQISCAKTLECAKFMYKFENGLLPISFNNYFTNLKSIHLYNTQYKEKSKIFFQDFIQTMVKKHFSMLEYKHGLKFLEKLNL